MADAIERQAGKTYAEQKLRLPKANDGRLLTSTATTSTETMPEEVPAGAKPPGQRVNWLGPRFEPPNISATATATDIQTAVRDAENGEPTSLFRFYRDALLGDEHIQGEFAKRKLAMLGQTMSVLPKDKENPDDMLAAAACLQAMEDCENWNAGLSALMDSSAIWPVSVVENVFKVADRPVRWMQKKTPKWDQGNKGPGGQAPEESYQEFKLQYTLKKLEPVNPMLFCFRHAYLVGGVGLGTASPMQQAGLMTDEQRRTGKIGTSPWYSIDLNDWEPFLRLWPIDEAGRIIYDTSTATKLDPTRHIVHRGHLLTQARDNWGGPGRAITSWWLLRGLGRDWFARFMERYGSPFPVGKTNVQDPQSVNLLQTAFSLASKIGGLVIGQDDAVELQSAMVQGGAEGHERWHNVCNDAISFAITGYKSSQKPAGLNAGEEGMISNIREDVRLFDQKTVSDTLVKQLFDRFLKFNGLQGCVRTVWGGLSDDDAATFATLVKTMSDAGFEPTDEAMPVVEERTGLQWQRKQIPTDLTTKGGKGPDGGDGEDGVETLAVRRFGKLVFFSAGGETSNIKHQTSNELDKVVEKRVERLAAAYKGAMAPFREIILSSDSREDCLKKLKAAYADWKPDRLADELEVALQMCAAAGAVKAKPE